MSTSKRPWWKDDALESKELSKEIFAHVNQLIEKRTAVENDWAIAEKLLGVNQSLQVSAQYKSASARVYKGISWSEDNRLKYNIIRPVRDTLKAHIAVTKPKPRYFPSNARFEQRERARNLTRYVRGVFVDTDAWSVGQQVFDDSTAYKIGFAKPVYVNDKIEIERVHPRCVVFDELPYGKPDLWYVVDTVSKWKLIDAYPEFEEQILASDDSIEIKNGDFTNSDDEQSDEVTVIELWYCPPDKKGKHIVCVSEDQLVNDPWKSNRPGLVPFVYDPPLVGMYGSSIVDKLKSIQKEVTFLLGRMQSQMNMGCFKLATTAVNASVEVIDNQDWQLIKLDPNSTITAIKLDALDPMFPQRLDSLESKAYQITGVSEQFGQSDKPNALNSGKAISEWEDIQTKRFLHLAQRWQSWYVLLGEAILDLARSVNYEVKMGLDVLKFSDIDMDADDYVVEAYPVSIVPDTPAGTIQSILDLAQTDPNIAADQTALLDQADLAAHINRELAPKLYVHKVIDNIVFDNKIITVTRDNDLNYMRQETLKAINQTMLYDKKKETETLRALMVKIGELQAPAQPLVAPPPAQPGMVPPGMVPPGMPPQGMPPPGMPPRPPAGMPPMAMAQQPQMPVPV